MSLDKVYYLLISCIVSGDLLFIVYIQDIDSEAATSASFCTRQRLLSLPNKTVQGPHLVRKPLTHTAAAVSIRLTVICPLAQFSIVACFHLNSTCSFHMHRPIQRAHLHKRTHSYTQQCTHTHTFHCNLRGSTEHLLTESIPIKAKL